MDVFVSERLQAIEEYKNTLRLSNQSAEEHNKAMNDEIAKLKSQGKDDEIHNLISMVSHNLHIVDVDAATKPHPEDYEADDEYYDDDWDEYDEYDDFTPQGSKSRGTVKGTGKGNYKDPYNSKHIRAVESRLANKAMGIGKKKK